MPRVLIAGPLRKRLFLEALPKLADRAIGFSTSPVLDRFETVGYKLVTLDRREAVVAHAAAQSGIAWNGMRINVSKIDEIVNAAFYRPTGPRTIYAIDEIGEMLLYSQAFQRALQEIFKAGATVAATVADKPKAYVDSLRKLKDVVWIDVNDENIGPARKRLFRELNLGVPSP